MTCFWRGVISNNSNRENQGGVAPAPKLARLDHSAQVTSSHGSAGAAGGGGASACAEAWWFGLPVSMPFGVTAKLPFGIAQGNQLGILAEPGIWEDSP